MLGEQNCKKDCCTQESLKSNRALSWIETAIPWAGQLKDSAANRCESASLSLSPLPQTKNVSKSDILVLSSDF